MLPAVHTLAARLLILLVVLAIGCDGGSDPPAAAAKATETSAKTAPAARRERPLPAFSGSTLEGQPLAVSDFLGQRLLVFFFDPSTEESAPAGRAVVAIAGLQGKNNFRILGVSTGGSTPQARAYVTENHIEFPVLNDASGSIAKHLGLSVSAAMLVVDAEGYVIGGMGGVAKGADDPAATLEEHLRESLRLPAAEPPLLEPGLGEYPTAPDFEAVTLDGETIRLSDLRGQPVVLIFFLYTCPHCHHAMKFLRGQLDGLAEAARPAVLGVSVSGSPSAVRAELKSKGFDFFPVVSDPDGRLRTLYGVVGGVPDILLIDKQGRIRARSQGWRDDRDPPLMRMRLAQLAGQPVPMLLHQTGYSGNEFCGVCHEEEAETWRFTRHAQAYDTLVKHAAERDAECVSCHVVGFDQKGGFHLDAPAPWLEDVGCEACHGRGGPHLSPNRVAGDDYKAVCVTCHDPKHSLGFDYATFRPIISHAANAHLLQLSPSEKRAKLAELGTSRKPLFPDAALVGSEACQGCHPSEYATWEAGPHGQSMASLASKGKAREADCQKCHTTGFGQPDGFPSGADPTAHADLARVGCESCHGPGGNHVAKGARRAGTIVSLTDKCDTCVILQICSGCHDDANDPGFEFAVDEKIEAQRHGTIEPSTGSPQARLAPVRDDTLDRLAIVERALATGGR